MAKLKYVWLTFIVFNIGNLYHFTQKNNKKATVAPKKPAVKDNVTPKPEAVDVKKDLSNTLSGANKSPEEKKNDLNKEIPQKPVDIKKDFVENKVINIIAYFLKKGIQSNFEITTNSELDLNLNINIKNKVSLGLTFSENGIKSSVNNPKADFILNINPIDFFYKISDIEFFSNFIYSPIIKTIIQSRFDLVDENIVFSYLLNALELFLEDTRTFKDIEFDISKIMMNIVDFQKKLSINKNFSEILPIFGSIIATSMINRFHNILLTIIASQLDKKGFQSLTEKYNKFYGMSFLTINKYIIKFIAYNYMIKNSKNIGEITEKLLNNTTAIKIKVSLKNKEEIIKNINNCLQKESLEKYIQKTFEKDYKDYQDKKIDREEFTQKQQEIKNLINGQLKELKNYLDHQNKKQFSMEIENILAKNINEKTMNTINQSNFENNFVVVESSKDLSNGKDGDYIYIIGKTNTNLLNFQLNNMNTKSLPPIIKTANEKQNFIIANLLVLRLINEFHSAGYNNDFFNFFFRSSNPNLLEYSLKISHTSTNQITDNLLSPQTIMAANGELNNNLFIKKVQEYIN